MKQSNGQAVTLALNHSGERLTLRRIKTEAGVEELRMTGSLPAHRQGPPLHIHFHEDEYVEVVSGALSALVDGNPLVIKAGDPGHFPKGSTHRWWNEGDEELVLRGVVTPAVDLDQYLQAMFEVLNAGAPNRPPIFYMAHVLYRHRKTQAALVVPRAVQRILFPIVVLLGTVLGKYRGTAWPGCPSRCSSAPLASQEHA
jgi:mannose-6-phosphate isomerase-like protein (cupin superfamily)